MAFSIISFASLAILVNLDTRISGACNLRTVNTAPLCQLIGKTSETGKILRP
jgi:hypothetical protein